MTKSAALLLISALFLGACDSRTGEQQAETTHKFADLVLANGDIYTGDETNPRATHLALADGVILAVGDAESVAPYVDEETERLNLSGQFVIPGIIDGHAHPAWGGLISNYYCLFDATALPNEIQEKIRSCVAQAPASETWIQGGLWLATFFDQYQIDSPRDWLDELSGDKAIALRDDSGHNYWVNSRALELLEITESSQPPKGGVFGRDSSGRLDGVLYESFGYLAGRLPPWTVTHYETGARYAMENAHQYGVTGWKDASATEEETAAYFNLDKAGELKVRVATSLYAASEGLAEIDIAAYERMRAQYRSTNVLTDFVKIFLDGIPTTSRTAAMVAPYVVEEGEEEDFGPLHVAPSDLARAVTELDALGFTVKIHTAGDRSVHEGLNAIAVARDANGMSERRHELAHAGFLVEQDIPRFRELNVVADLSPHLWFPSPIIISVREALGQRGLRYWPNRDLIDAGAPLLLGSDWPSVARDMNPWIGLESLVTRKDPVGSFPGEGWRDQSITLEEGFAIMTLGGARALKVEHEAGTLVAGKSADFAVLNHNIFEVEVSAVSETRAVATYFRGELVYGNLLGETDD